jgi:hypothetical protein
MKVVVVTIIMYTYLRPERFQCQLIKIQKQNVIPISQKLKFV